MIGRFMIRLWGGSCRADRYSGADNSQNYIVILMYSITTELHGPECYFSKFGSNTGQILRAIAKVPILNTASHLGLNFIHGCQVWAVQHLVQHEHMLLRGVLKAAFNIGAINSG